VARSEDLVRQVNEATAALAERAEVERDVRRQLAEQVARSEDLVRQVNEATAALAERAEVERAPAAR
jgi:hypothetical protein